LLPDDLAAILQIIASRSGSGLLELGGANNLQKRLKTGVSIGALRHHQISDEGALILLFNILRHNASCHHLNFWGWCRVLLWFRTYHDSKNFPYPDHIADFWFRR
jgi:hypothetical protein